MDVGSWYSHIIFHGSEVKSEIQRICRPLKFPPRTKIASIWCCTDISMYFSTLNPNFKSKKILHPYNISKYQKSSPNSGWKISFWIWMLDIRSASVSRNSCFVYRNIMFYSTWGGVCSSQRFWGYMNSLDFRIRLGVIKYIRIPWSACISRNLIFHPYLEDVLALGGDIGDVRFVSPQTEIQRRKILWSVFQVRNLFSVAVYFKLLL